VAFIEHVVAVESVSLGIGARAVCESKLQDRRAQARMGGCGLLESGMVSPGAKPFGAQVATDESRRS
jgi:hypothetical protein